MVVAEIVSGLAGIKTALDILKGLKKSDASSNILSEIADLQTALIEVQQGIIAANQTHTEDIDRIRGLEAQVASFEAWEREKARYELKPVPPASFVYALKPDMAAGEPLHWLCATCYQRGEKSFLQRGSYGGFENFYFWDCHTCGKPTRVEAGLSPNGKAATED